MKSLLYTVRTYANASTVEVKQNHPKAQVKREGTLVKVRVFRPEHHINWASVIERVGFANMTYRVMRAYLTQPVR
jgi:hypothetical protein